MVWSQPIRSLLIFIFKWPLQTPTLRCLPPLIHHHHSKSSSLNILPFFSLPPRFLPLALRTMPFTYSLIQLRWMFSPISIHLSRNKKLSVKWRIFFAKCWFNQVKGPSLIWFFWYKIWHFCEDFRGLNTIIVKDKFLIQTIDKLLDDLGSVGWFSKLDLAQGFHHIRMILEDIPKMVFCTH